MHELHLAATRCSRTEKGTKLLAEPSLVRDSELPLSENQCSREPPSVREAEMHVRPILAAHA
jgi:hypothetical protein